MTNDDFNYLPYNQELHEFLTTDYTDYTDFLKQGKSHEKHNDKDNEDARGRGHDDGPRARRVDGDFGIMVGERNKDMAILEWQEEIAGDSADLVETEWDAELDKRLHDVENGGVELVDHAESMRAAREQLASRSSRRAVA